MKILMVSWEYPPKDVGGVSNHVYFLARCLHKLGHEVHVLTCLENDANNEEEKEGVFIHRAAPYALPSEDFTRWVMHLNFAMIEMAIKLINSQCKFDIIHCHDWLSLYAGKALKTAYNIPLVATIHATEHGRNSGIRSQLENYISSAEWLLTYEAWKVITCSGFMKEEVINIFNVPEDKITVIPNGVSLEEYKINFDSLEFRKKYALEDEKLVFYVGRHVYEKGIQLLIDTAPDIISSCDKIKFIIAGKGNMTERLKEKVKFLGLENKIIFTGYMGNEDKIKLFKIADAAVFPSLYEPFGIVALEAMAAKCPIIVSDVGGLKEIVEHKVNGMKIIAGSKDSLKDNLLELLKDEALANTLKEKAYETVHKLYEWDNIAKKTEKLYEIIKKEAKGTKWEINNVKRRKKTPQTKL
jgi:glycogen synthase